MSIREQPLPQTKGNYQFNIIVYQQPGLLLDATYRTIVIIN